MKSPGIINALIASKFIWAVIGIAAVCLGPSMAAAREDAPIIAGNGPAETSIDELLEELPVRDAGTRPDCEKDKIRYRITGEVYHGNKYRFEKPCTLCRKEVFEEIPEYQTIKRERLNKHSARYHILIQQANRVFRGKIKEALEDLDYDLVVEKKGIKAAGRTKIPDITDEVIEKITG